MSFPLEPFNEWLSNVSLGALSTRDTVKSSYDIARWTVANGIPGDFVETGVFGGAQCAAMARAILDSAGFSMDYRNTPAYQGRRVHLFDTFCGLPAPGPKDPEIEPHMAAAFTRQTTCSLADCQDHMRGWGLPDELFVWHEGLFADTVPRFVKPFQQIAILRLDGDLYESTKTCLEHLYPLLSPGGWCIIDDFGLAGARDATIEYMRDQFGPVQWRKR